MNRNNRKYGIMSIIDNLVWAAIGALFVVIAYMNTNQTTKIIYAAILILFACLYMWFIYVKATKSLVVATPVEMIQENYNQIRKVILLNDEYQVLKQWNIEGKAGLLIGKSTKEQTVDIDLSDTALSALISNEHALLNYTNGNWFIEDFDSEQGTAVQKANKNELQYLTKSEPIQLEAGDFIYIGKTILQVK